MITESQKTLTAAYGPNENRELNYVTNELKSHLKDVLILLEKESRGAHVYFAIDFDILHTYLYPSRRIRSSQVSSTLASYVLEKCPAKFFLPPGTVHELVEFLDKFNAARSRLSRVNTSSEISEDEKHELIELYRRIIDDEFEIQSAIRNSERLIWGLRSTFSEITNSLRKLYRLIADSRIVPLLSVETSTTVTIDAADLNTISARMSALRPRYRRSNERDAMNIATIVRAFQSQDCLNRLEHLKDDLSGLKTFHLITGTPALLNVNLDDFGTDIIGRNVLQLLPEFFSERRSNWYVFNLTSAAIYTSLRTSSSNLESVLDRVHKIYCEISEIGVKTLTHSTLSRGRDSIHLLRMVDSLPEELSNFYVPFRHLLSTGMSEVEEDGKFFDLLDSNATNGFPAENERVEGFWSAISESESQTSDFIAPEESNGILRIFSVRRTEAILGEFNKMKAITFQSETNKINLFRIESWNSEDFLTASWPTFLTISEVVDLFCSLAECVDDEAGVVSAEFNAELYASLNHLSRSNNSSYDEKVRKTIRISSHPKTFTVIDFVKSSHDGSTIITPTCISLECRLGDLHYMPSVSNSENSDHSSFVLSTNSEKFLEKLGGDRIFSTHMWGWNPPMLSRFYRDLNQEIQSLSLARNAI